MSKYFFEIKNATFFARPGTFVEFVVEREGKELVIPVKVASRPAVENHELTETPKDLNQSENP